MDRSEQGTTAAAEVGANAYTSGDTIVMPSSHGPLDRGRGRELLAHELVHVNQQRRLGSALPAEDSGAGQTLEREAQQAERLVGSASPSRLSTPAMPLARPQRAASETVSPGAHNEDVRQATSTVMAMGDRVSAIAGSESLELPGPGAPTAGAPPPQRSPSSSSGAAGASDATSADAGDDFEELSRRIYERVRLRLRRELLLDRERGGYLTDSR